MLGALLILISGSFIGWIIASQYLKRIKQLKQVRTAINLFDAEISYNQSVLHEVLYKIADNLNYPISHLFSNSAEKLSQKKGRLFNDIWKKELNNNFKKNCLKKEDKKILNEWGMQIGNSNLDGQKKINKLTQKKIDKSLSQARNEAEKKVKLIRYSGILISLVIIILLY